MKISSKEKKLLISALFIILAIVVYIQILVPKQEALKRVKAEHAGIQAEYELSEQQLKDEKTFDADIKKNTDIIEKYLSNFYDQTLQEKFIRKIEDMWYESRIVFRSTGYSQINETVAGETGGVDIESQIPNVVDRGDKTEEEIAEEEMAGKEQLRSKFREFMKNLNVTTISFSFSGTYSQIWDFVNIMDVNSKDGGRYVVANTFSLAGGSNENEDGGIPFSKQSGEELTANVTMYFFMTNDTEDYLKIGDAK